MPELPEVEIVKRSLLNKVKNQKISKVGVFNRKLRYRIEAVSYTHQTLPTNREV